MYKFFNQNFYKLLYCSILIIFSFSVTKAQRIEGFVFIDSNNNSLMDPDEKGLKGVLVSNQKDVVITDQNGYFQIKTIEGNFIFVTKPKDYQFKLDEYYNPQFYFYYHTKRIKEPLKYPVSDPINEIPEVLYFPIVQNKGEEEHASLLIGDPQMKGEKRLGYYKNGIMPFLALRDADFYITLGDIAHNKLDVLKEEKKITAGLGIPGYRVMGNHDMNFRALDNKYANETFKKVYGPEYYSFDYGNVHYIILNSIIYKGWWREMNVPGTYHGGLTNQQIKWLENDLMFVSAEKIIVLLSHIPLSDSFITTKSMLGLIGALKNHKKIFAVSGHLHNVIAYDFSEEQGFGNDVEYEGLVAGAVCGSWWSGPLDENEIPFSTCTDGSPKGFFQMNVMKDNYNYIFHPINYSSDYQMRTYVLNDEVWVNWFVGKQKDSVWVYIDNNSQKITLNNFIGKDPFMVSALKERIYNDKHLTDISKTSHLWKAKLPIDLEPGYHSLNVFAKDSKGKIFKGFKVFYIKD